MQDYMRKQSDVYPERDRATYDKPKTNFISLLAGLSKREKVILYLEFVEGLARKEIAKHMQLSPCTISMIKAAALKHLRKRNDLLRY